jgi:hypothetical protein
MDTDPSRYKPPGLESKSSEWLLTTQPGHQLSAAFASSLSQPNQIAVPDTTFSMSSPGDSSVPSFQPSILAMKYDRAWDVFMIKGSYRAALLA